MSSKISVSQFSQLLLHSNYLFVSWLHHDSSMILDTSAMHTLSAVLLLTSQRHEETETRLMKIGCWCQWLFSGDDMTVSGTTTPCREASEALITWKPCPVNERIIFIMTFPYSISDLQQDSLRTKLRPMGKFLFFLQLLCLALLILSCFYKQITSMINLRSLLFPFCQASACKHLKYRLKYGTNCVPKTDIRFLIVAITSVHRI